MFRDSSSTLRASQQDLTMTWDGMKSGGAEGRAGGVRAHSRLRRRVLGHTLGSLAPLRN